MSNKAKIYLYKEGNECTAITGGWTFKYSSTNSNLNLQGNKQSTKIYMFASTNSSNISGNIQAVPTKIPLFNVSKLYWDFDAKITTPNTQALLTVNNKNLQYIYSMETLSRQITEYDISDNINSICCCIGTPTQYEAYSHTLNIYSLYLRSTDDVMSVDIQDKTIIVNFNNFDGIIAFENATVIVNGEEASVFNDITDTISFDETLLKPGNNEIIIQATYTQGDGIYETAVLETTTIIPGNKIDILEPIVKPEFLPNNASLDMLLEKISEIRNVYNININNMKKILSVNGIAATENDMSSLIEKVSGLNMQQEIASSEDVERLKTILTNKNIELTGDESFSELIEKINELK